MLRKHINTRSIQFALSRRVTTEPLSSRKVSWSLRCWNSQARLHTSSSFNCLLDPTEIRGDIQETVMNCHNVKLSSGLRSWASGGWEAWPISSRGSSGCLSGMQKMTPTIVVAEPASKRDGISLVPRFGPSLVKRMIQETEMPNATKSNRYGGVLGLSITTMRTADSCESLG